MPKQSRRQRNGKSSRTATQTLALIEEEVQDCERLDTGRLALIDACNKLRRSTDIKNTFEAVYMRINGKAKPWSGDEWRNMIASRVRFKNCNEDLSSIEGNTKEEIFDKLKDCVADAEAMITDAVEKLKPLNDSEVQLYVPQIRRQLDQLTEEFRMYVFGELYENTFKRTYCNRKIAFRNLKDSLMDVKLEWHDNNTIELARLMLARSIDPITNFRPLLKQKYVYNLGEEAGVQLSPGTTKFMKSTNRSTKQTYRKHYKEVSELFLDDMPELEALAKRDIETSHERKVECQLQRRREVVESSKDISESAPREVDLENVNNVVDDLGLEVGDCHDEGADNTDNPPDFVCPSCKFVNPYDARRCRGCEKDRVWSGWDGCSGGGCIGIEKWLKEQRGEMWKCLACESLNVNEDPICSSCKVVKGTYDQTCIQKGSIGLGSFPVDTSSGASPAITSSDTYSAAIATTAPTGGAGIGDGGFFFPIGTSSDTSSAAIATTAPTGGAGIGDGGFFFPIDTSSDTSSHTSSAAIATAPTGGTSIGRCFFPIDKSSGTSSAVATTGDAEDASSVSTTNKDSPISKDSCPLSAVFPDGKVPGTTDATESNPTSNASPPSSTPPTEPDTSLAADADTGKSQPPSTPLRAIPENHDDDDDVDEWDLMTLEMFQDTIDEGIDDIYKKKEEELEKAARLREEKASLYGEMGSAAVDKSKKSWKNINKIRGMAKTPGRHKFIKTAVKARQEQAHRVIARSGVPQSEPSRAHTVRFDETPSSTAKELFESRGN